MSRFYGDYLSERGPVDETRSVRSSCFLLWSLLREPARTYLSPGTMSVITPLYWEHVLGKVTDNGEEPAQVVDVLALVDTIDVSDYLSKDALAEVALITDKRARYCDGLTDWEVDDAYFNENILKLDQ